MRSRPQSSPRERTTTAARTRQLERARFACRTTQPRRMPLPLSAAGSTLAIRKPAFEQAGLTREAVDRVLNLTDEEFRVEGALVVIGPLTNADDVPDLIDLFEETGLTYFDDFMEIPGGFPDWIELFIRHA